MRTTQMIWALQKLSSYNGEQKGWNAYKQLPHIEYEELKSREKAIFSLKSIWKNGAIRSRCRNVATKLMQQLKIYYWLTLENVHRYVHTCSMDNNTGMSIFASRWFGFCISAFGWKQKERISLLPCINNFISLHSVRQTDSWTNRYNSRRSLCQCHF